jgi:hypothetical protein
MLGFFLRKDLADLGKAFDGISGDIYDTAAVHESQRDNKDKPHNECAITCNSMLLQTAANKGTLKVKLPHKLEDKIVEDIKTNFTFWRALALKKIGTSFENYVQARMDFNFIALYNKERYNLKCKVRSSLTSTDVAYRVEASGLPIMISTGKYLTIGGHIILVRGRIVNPDKSVTLIVNDPWGRYPYNSHDGEAVIYPASMFPGKRISLEIEEFL